MQHNESYQGRTVIVTTMQHADGLWTYRAEVLDERLDIPSVTDQRYSTENDARGAGFSAAAAAVDRLRTSRGKP